MKNRNITGAAARVVRPAVVAAILLAGQVALRAVPNVEIVTVVIIVCAYAFPPGVSLAAVFVFCTGEWLLYGYGYWVIAYYLYWPALAGFSLLLKKVRKSALRAVFAVLTAAVFTALFGVLTSAVDAAAMSGFSPAFFQYFAFNYVRGIYFYIVHIVSNIAITAVLFPVLSAAVKKIAE